MEQPLENLRYSQQDLNEQQEMGQNNFAPVIQNPLERRSVGEVPDTSMQGSPNSRFQFANNTSQRRQTMMVNEMPNRFPNLLGQQPIPEAHEEEKDSDGDEGFE